MDLTPLLDAAGGDATLLHQLLAMARQQLSELPPTLEAAQRANDLLAIARAAHKVRPVAQTLTLGELNECLAKLEVLAKATLLHGAPGTLKETERQRFAEQLSTLSAERKEWLKLNLSPRMVGDLINMCKLRSQNALDDPAWDDYPDIADQQ